MTCPLSPLVVIGSVCYKYYVKLCLVYMFVTILLSCCNNFVLHLYTIGADPQAKDKDGYTPLFWACYEGHKEVSGLLLEHGELPLYILLKCLEFSVPSG